MERIGILWNCDVQLTASTVRYEPYIEGFQKINLDSVVICKTGFDIGFPYPCINFENESELENGKYWKKLGCNILVLITWHRMTKIIKAAREAGLKVLAIGESDGQVLTRLFPKNAYRRIVLYQKNLIMKFRALKFFLSKFIFDKLEKIDFLENTTAPNVYTLAGSGPVECFKECCQSIGLSDYNISILPYPIPNYFISESSISDKKRNLLAIGRWSSSQKYPQLLRDLIIENKKRKLELDIHIFGENSIELFKGLDKRVYAHGVVERSDILPYFVDARSLLITSLWEGVPLVANEMLSLGGTIIGTPIPSVKGIINEGPFGTMASSFNVKSMIEAIEKEMKLWDSGARNPNQIACYWRNRCSPESVARKIVDLLEKQSSVNN